MGDLIPSQHMINVFEVFGWALADTVRELDHVQRREDITAENFITVLSSKVQHLDSDAKRLGVDVRFVSELVSALQDTCQRRSKSTPLAGVKMHHLMRFSPALAVVPVVHRRDPRCFV